MVIPPDGSLPQITRTGFMPFNNVMVIKIPENVGKKDKMVYNLVTLDITKKGERWPAEIQSEEKEEVTKKPVAPEITANKCSPETFKKPEETIVKSPKIPFRKKIMKRQRPIINKTKFKPSKIQKYSVQADEIEPWLPGSGLSTNTVPPFYTQPITNFYTPPLLNRKGLLGNSPSDLINNALIINANLQNRISRNIKSTTNLPLNDCHSNREQPSVNTAFENAYHMNFRNEPLTNEKYNVFDDPYKGNGSRVFPYNRNYNNLEREKSSISPHFKRQFEPNSNYRGNVGDLPFRNHSQDFDGNRIPTSAQSHRIDTPNCRSGELFRGAERDFPVDAIDDFPNSNRNGHQQNKFIRNGPCEVFEETAAYGKDILYNPGYNEMPRNNFSEFKMDLNRDFRNRRGSKDRSPSNNSYDNYAEIHRENPADFYGQYTGERVWDNGPELSPSFRANYRRNRKPFHKRNKSAPWRKNAFKNSQQNASKRGRK